jgi:hypothetical protein
MSAKDRNHNTPHFAVLRAGYLLYLFLTAFCCQEAAAKSNKPPVFELQNTAPLCLVRNPNVEKCIDFTIKIYANGRVHYYGQKAMAGGWLRQAVRVLGDRHGKITQAQVAELAKTFESFPLEDIQRFRDRYGNQVGGGVIKYKTDTQDLRINFIPFFDVMTTKLNEFINIEKWICFPKGHIEHDNCLLRYYPTGLWRPLGALAVNNPRRGLRVAPGLLAAAFAQNLVGLFPQAAVRPLGVVAMSDTGNYTIESQSYGIFSGILEMATTHEIKRK